MEQHNSKDIALLDRIKSRTAVEDFFFKRLAKSSDRVRWFSLLKERGYFDAAKAPEPIGDNEKGYFIPSWQVLDYLIALSIDAEKSNDVHLQKELISIVKAVSKRRVDNFRIYSAFAELLSHVPTEMIDDECIALTQAWFKSRFAASLVLSEVSKSLLPHLLAKQEDAKKVTTLVRHGTQLTHVKRNNSQEISTSVEPYWVNEFVTRNAKALGERCGRQVIRLFRRRLKTVIPTTPGGDDYSYISRPTIEGSHHSGSHHEIVDIFVEGLRDALIGHYSMDTVSSQKILISLLTEESTLMRRIAIYVVSTQWKNFDETFPLIITRENLSDDNHRHEIYGLLKANFSSLSAKHQDQILEFIRLGPTDVSNEANEQSHQHADLWRQRWLSALGDAGSAIADQEFKAVRERTGVELPHPDRPFFTEVGYVVEKSPITIDDLATRELQETLDFLNSFKPEVGWDKPSVEGLGNTFRGAVKGNSGKYLHTPEAVAKLKPVFLYYLFSGLEDSFKAIGSLDWEKVFKLIETVIAKESFWTDPSRYENSDIRYVSWAASSICGLIREGAVNDSRSIPPEYIPRAEAVLLEIIKHRPAGIDKMSDSPLTDAFNTPLGKAFETALALSLHTLRTKISDKWLSGIRLLFETQVSNLETRALDFSAIAGGHIPQLMYLDREWTNAALPTLFADPGSAHWTACMKSHLETISTFYTDLFRFLRENGHYQAALDSLSDRHREKLIDYITAGFLNGEEDIDAGLFRDLLNKRQGRDLSNLIRFIWMHRDVELADGTKKRIGEFWELCLASFVTSAVTPTDEDKKILSDLTQLTPFIQNLGEKELGRLKLSAPFVEINFHSPFFIEDLESLSKNFGKEVAEIYIEMMRGCAPTYPAEKIRSLVISLKDQGLRNEVGAINNQYLLSGSQIIRDIAESA